MSFSPGGVDWKTAQQILARWVANGSGLPTASIMWAGQDAARPPAPAIIMRLSNVAETGAVWVDRERNTLAFTPKVVTAVNVGASSFTIPGHALNNADGPVQVASDGAVPGGSTPSTNYWPIVLDANTVQLADSFAHAGGAGKVGAVIPIALQDAGSGTITLNSTVDTVPAGQELLEVARGYLRVTLELHCHSEPGIGLAMATSLLQRVRTRRKWTSQQELLKSINVGLLDVDRVRAINGTRDALLFEPRAYLDVHLCFAVEETSTITVIETADVTNQITSTTSKLVV